MTPRVPDPQTPPEPEFGLSHADPARLSRLWSAVVPTIVPGTPSPRAGSPNVTAAVWEAGDLAEMLRLQLAAPLDPPPDLGPDGDAPVTYAELFADPAPPADALRRVKDWAKPQMGEDPARGVELPREVAGVIYFAAVAAARLRVPGGDRVSALGDERVRRGAAWALGLPWLDTGTAALFRTALAAIPTVGPASPSH